MSTDTHQLIQQSLQGDQRAFGQIVERYQGAVSAMAYSVTGNLAQSEDLAQEAFIIAWKKLGALQKHESLPAWLCGIARNLARDWMRTQAARPTVSMEHLDETVQPLGESPVAAQQRHERADLVWTALAEIPENYREPLILFYRQGESIRDIAEALELSEDNVKQRLSRGRKLLRAEVARTVEDTLTDTRPGKAFTAGVLAALPALYGAKAGTAEAATTSAKAAAAPAAMGALIKIALPVAVVAGLVLGGVWLAQNDASNMDSRLANPTAVGDVSPASSTTPAPTGSSDLADASDSPGLTAAVPTGVVTGQSVSGTVVFRDTGEPAPGMRVMLYMDRQKPREIKTAQEGTFLFESVPAGDYFLLASDARVEFSTQNSWCSEEEGITVSEGTPILGLRLEVPPLGESLVGRITDAQTGEPIAGIQVAALRFGGGHATGKSDADGRYLVIGLEAGAWLAQIDEQNPLFAGGVVAEMENIHVEEGKQAELDFVLDRGIPIHGITVDQDGAPIADAGVDADLFPSDGHGLRCIFRTDSVGKFTVWGARPGDRVVLRAVKDVLGAHLAVAQLKQGETPDPITLTLLPKTTVSGRFEDEQGRPVEAQFWSQPHHPETSRNWRGHTDHGTTFTAELTQGTHDLMGLAKGMNLDMNAPTQRVEVGPTPIEGLVVSVLTLDPTASSHSLSGRVVDGQGKPLVRCRLYIRGDSRDTYKNPSQETHTNDTGEFHFNGLADGSYTVHAVPGIDLYEQVSGYEKLNPVDTPEVTIVARLAPTLRGRVLDAGSGEPITSFTVECGELNVHDYENRWGPDSPNIHSENGEFSIPARLDMNWYLRVSAPGYAPQRLDGVVLEPGEVTAMMEFKLSPGRTAAGTVVDSEGTPVARAQIYLRKGFAEGPATTGDPVTETDSEGRFQIASIAEDEEFVYAWQKGFAFVREAIGEDIRLVLHHGGTIEGQVTANGVVPSGGYSLFATIPDTHFGTSATVEPDGSYRFEGLMEIGYRLQVTFEAEGKRSKYYSTGEVIEVKRDQVTTHDFDFPIGNGVVEGTVHENGVPVAGVDISCRNNRVSTYASTDENGLYRFEDLSPGTVTLSSPATTTSRSQTYQEIASLEIVADEVIQHDIELPRN